MLFCVGGGGEVVGEKKVSIFRPSPPAAPRLFLHKKASTQTHKHKTHQSALDDGPPAYMVPAWGGYPPAPG